MKRAWMMEAKHRQTHTQEHSRKRRNNSKLNPIEREEIELRVSEKDIEILKCHEFSSLCNQAYVSADDVIYGFDWAMFNDRIVLRVEPCSLVPKGVVVLDGNQRRSLGGVQPNEVVFIKRYDHYSLSDLNCSQIWLTVFSPSSYFPVCRLSSYPQTMPMLEQIIHTKFLGHVMTEGQSLLLDTSRDEKRRTMTFDLTITEIFGGKSGQEKLARGVIEKSTIIRAFPGNRLTHHCTRTPVINKFRYDFDLNWLEGALNAHDIGGLSNTLKTILEGVFGSESLPLPYCSSLSLARRKVKGVIFYGQPDTRLTALARIMHNILGTTEPKIIRNSIMPPKDLLSLFREAIQDDLVNRCCRFVGKKDGIWNQLHLFLIEDIEYLRLEDQPNAINAINWRHATLASLMDKLDNILIIGTTSRFDRVRPNILWPGRFELQVKFDLPNNRERSDILKMYAFRIIQNKCLNEEDWDTQELALWTYGYTAFNLYRIIVKALHNAKKRVPLHSSFYPEGTRVCMEDFYFVIKPLSIKINMSGLDLKHIGHLPWVVDQLKSLAHP